MLAVDAQPAAGPLASIGRKALALLVFALAALILYFVDRLPSAGRIDDQQWTVRYPRGLARYGNAAGPVFELTGAIGAGLDVRADTARLTPETIGQIVAAGHRAPAAKASALTWFGRAGSGRIGLTIVNARFHPGAGLAMVPTGTPDMPQLRITAIETSLRFDLQSIAGDETERPATLFKVDGTAVPQPWASAMPVAFDLPPGQSVLLTFPSADAVKDAGFRFGAPGSSGEIVSHLPIRRFAIGSAGAPGGPALTSIDRGVCSAPIGTILPRTRLPRLSDCTAGGDLALESFEVDAGRLQLSASGAGFRIEDGATVSAGLVSAIANNKVIAALLAIVYTTLAGWVWKTVTGAGRV